MFRIRKRVFDTYWVKKCNRNICKCIVSLKDKESISIKEVQRHRDCYNCDIINNRTTSAGTDPPLRFNETRDAPIIRDSSQYYFSIVRFSMNGPNKELPIFIPSIQTHQDNINLTNYSLRIKGIINDPNNPDNLIHVDSGEVFVMFQQIGRAHV